MSDPNSKSCPKIPLFFWKVIYPFLISGGYDSDDDDDENLASMK